METSPSVFGTSHESVMGTCSLCNGVVVKSNYWPTPPPRCRDCGATKKPLRPSAVLPVIQMEKKDAD